MKKKEEVLKEFQDYLESARKKCRLPSSGGVTDGMIARLNAFSDVLKNLNVDLTQKINELLLHVDEKDVDEVRDSLFEAADRFKTNFWT